MTELPTTGGSYYRDAETGALSLQPAEAEQAETSPAADAPTAAPSQDPAPAPRRSTSTHKGGN